MTGSNKEQGLPLLHRMASEGWACFSVCYRLAPDDRFPAMLEDVLRAIAWIKENAETYGADANYIVLTGGSAGGHLTSIAALLEERSTYQKDFEDVDTRPALAVPVYGRFDFLNQHGILPGKGLEPFLTSKVMPGSPEECPDLWTLGSPESLVHPNAPPFMIVHGSADALIPFKEAECFYQALSAVSDQPVNFLGVDGAQHGFDMLMSSWSLPVIDGLARYFNAHFRSYLAAED